MIKITIGTQVWTAPALDNVPEDAARAMLAAYQAGTPPKVEALAVETIAAPAGVKVPIGHDLPFPEPSNVDRIKSTLAALAPTTEGVKDFWPMVGGRITGETYADHKVVTGTEHYGQKRHEACKAMHDREVPVVDAAHALIRRVESENRKDVAMSAAELGSAIALVDGKVMVNGRRMTEQSIRGLAARLESPMLSYVLGVRERIVENKARKDGGCATSRTKDAAMIADILAHECKRNPDVPLKLRTRNGGNDDVFAIVSPSYAPADAPAVLGRLVDSLPPDAKGEAKYDPHSTAWELRASVWTPRPVDQHAVGEPFAGYASLRGRDNGTGRLGGGGGIEILSCLNSAVFIAESRKVSRIHRGGILADVNAMIEGAIASIGVLCEAWGVARQEVIPMTDEEKAIGDAFMVDLFESLLKDDRELCSVLPGRTEEHAKALTRVYHTERRDPDRLVKADIAQSWTRYIQGQPSGVRQDAEAAIGRWMVLA